MTTQFVKNREWAFAIGDDVDQTRFATYMENIEKLGIHASVNVDGLVAAVAGLTAASAAFVGAQYITNEGLIAYCVEGAGGTYSWQTVPVATNEVVWIRPLLAFRRWTGAAWVDVSSTLPARLGAQSFTSNLITSLDAFVENGFAVCTAAATNNPFPGFFAHVFCESYGATWARQTASLVTTAAVSVGDVKVRFLKNGVWTAWQNFGLGGGGAGSVIHDTSMTGDGASVGTQLAINPAGYSNAQIRALVDRIQADSGVGGALPDLQSSVSGGDGAGIFARNKVSPQINGSGFTGGIISQSSRDVDSSTTMFVTVPATNVLRYTFTAPRGSTTYGVQVMAEDTLAATTGTASVGKSAAFLNHVGNTISFDAIVRTSNYVDIFFSGTAPQPTNVETTVY